MEVTVRANAPCLGMTAGEERRVELTKYVERVVANKWLSIVKRHPEPESPVPDTSPAPGPGQDPAGELAGEPHGERVDAEVGDGSPGASRADSAEGSDGSATDPDADLAAPDEGAERRDAAVQMRADGATYQQITDQLGYTSRSAAIADITRAYQAQGR